MGEKGFTLIEMLLVVAIIGFLVAILLPSVGGFGADAKAKAVKADLRQLKSAVEIYYIAFGEYPLTDDWGNENNDLVKATGSGYNRLIDQFPQDPYMKSAVGIDESYNYMVSGDYYIITSDLNAAGGPNISGPDVAEPNGATLYATNCAVSSP